MSESAYGTRTTDMNSITAHQEFRLTLPTGVAAFATFQSRRRQSHSSATECCKVLSLFGTPYNPGESQPNNEDRLNLGS